MFVSQKTPIRLFGDRIKRFAPEALGSPGMHRRIGQRCANGEDIRLMSAGLKRTRVARILRSPSLFVALVPTSTLSLSLDYFSRSCFL